MHDSQPRNAFGCLGTASESPSPSDARRPSRPPRPSAPTDGWMGGRAGLPTVDRRILATWEPPRHRPSGEEAGPTTGRRRQRVAAEAATPPGVVTLTRPHAAGLGGRRRRYRGRRSVGSTSSICETLFLKNCTTKGNNYLIGEREGSEGKALKDGSKIRLEQYQEFRR